MPFNIDEHTGILIKKAARLFEQAANRDLDKLGVTYVQTIFLVRLWDRDGQSQIELTRSAGLKQPTVVRILDCMEKSGLITRIRHKEDRRVFQFFLTDKAKKACRKLEDHANAMHEIATKQLPQKDIDKFNKVLSQIICNLENFL